MLRSISLPNKSPPPRSSSTLPPSISPSRIDSLEEKDSVLGRGSFGKVCKALLNKHTLVAQKVPAHEEDSEKIQREANILLFLGSHPNIISLIGVTRKDGILTLIMSFASMGNLKEFLSQNEETCSLRLRFKLAMDIVMALLYIHQKNVIHHDIKPGNILLSGDNTNNMYAQVGDFGSAKRLTEEQPMCKCRDCTVRYAAAEILREEPHGLEVDVFSLGLTLYQLLSGKSAYPEGLEEIPLIYLIGSGHLKPSIDDVPQKIKDFLSPILKDNPSCRPKMPEINERLASLATLELPSLSSLSLGASS
jgi:serine/threonine protein kinase